MNNQAKGGNFSNGFLWGVVVGAAIVFLLATKKGRKILKTLTEDGLEGISDIYELFEEEKKKTKSCGDMELDEDEDENFSEAKISTKRFFKGIPKKN